MNITKLFWLSTLISFAGCSGSNDDISEGESNDLAIVVYADADGSLGADGTRDKPFTLQEAIDLESEVIVLLDQAGPFVGRYKLSSNQSLIGGGDFGVAEHQLPSGDRVDISGLGGRPIIVNVDDPIYITSPITLSDDTMIAGIEVVGGTDGIRCDHSDNIVLKDLRVTESEFHGLDLNSCDNQTISDITITDVEIVAGISILDSMNVNISSVDVITNGESLVDKTSFGIDIAGSDYVEINNFYMNDADSSGIKVNGITELHLTNILIESSLFYGLDISASEIFLSDIHISNTGQEGVLLEGETIQMDRIELSDIGGDALVFDQHYDASSITITIDNTVVNSASSGIYFAFADSVSITGNDNTFMSVDSLCRVNGEIDIFDSIEISQGMCITPPNDTGVL